MKKFYSFFLLFMSSFLLSSYNELDCLLGYTQTMTNAGLVALLKDNATVQIYEGCSYLDRAFLIYNQDGDLSLRLPYVLRRIIDSGEKDKVVINSFNDSKTLILRCPENFSGPIIADGLVIYNYLKRK